MGTRASFAGDSVAFSLLPVAAVTADGNGTGVDITDYSGPMAVILRSAAGTSDTLTTNGAMAADTDWTKGTGWTIGAGVATFAGHTTTSDLSQNQACTEGLYYVVVFTVGSWTAGTLTPYIGGTAGTAVAADGTYTQKILCGAGVDPKLAFRASSTFRGTIDNVAVYEASLAVHLEHSADDSSYANITGAVFSTVYADAAVLEKIVIQTDECRQYLRAVKDITGASASFTCDCTAIGCKKYT